MTEPLVRQQRSQGVFPIRSFTEEGLAEFRAWLGRAETGSPPRYAQDAPPIHLLHDDRFAVEVGYGDPIRPRRFDRKYDMGMEVCRAVGADMRQLLLDANAWAWLSLFFYENTFPIKKNGLRFTGQSLRHIVEKIPGMSFDHSHRHLVKGAATNVFLFGPYAEVLMSGPDQQAKIEEQIMSRRDDPPLSFLTEIIRALYQLYWDVDANAVKKGAGGEGPGSIMHVRDLIPQFDLTYDICDLQADQLIGMLPRDFGPFIDGNGSGRKKRRRRAEAVNEVSAAA